MAKDNPDQPPTRSQRQQCWDARDKYFGCLDKTGLVDAVPDPNVCSADRQGFERHCIGSWVRGEPKG